MLPRREGTLIFTFADRARSKGKDGLLEPDAIADAYWAPRRQSKTAWAHELDLRPFKEPL